MENSEQFISSLDDDETNEDEKHHQNGSLNEVIKELLFHTVLITNINHKYSFSGFV